MVNYLNVGNDIVNDYPSLKNTVKKYLDGGEIDQDLIDRRHQFIQDYLYSNDGHSAERCADALFKHLNGAKPKRSIYNYKVLLKYLRNYRFDKNWLASKRDESHIKYINPNEVHAEMKKCMDFFGCQVDYCVEM